MAGTRGEVRWLGDAVHVDVSEGNSYYNGFVHESTEYHVEDCVYVMAKNEKKVCYI